LNVFDSVLLALRQVWAQKLKSFFSLLGVIVGVTFLISVIAVVEGMNLYVQQDFAGSIFGINTVTIERARTRRTGREDARTRRQRSRNPDITIADAEMLRTSVPDISYMAYNVDRFMPEVRSRQQRRKNVRLIGVNSDYLALQGWDIVEGRGISPLDDRRSIRLGRCPLRGVSGGLRPKTQRPRANPAQVRLRRGDGHRAERGRGAAAHAPPAASRPG
jgi:putative ABC transport system permease protein